MAPGSTADGQRMPLHCEGLLRVSSGNEGGTKLVFHPARTFAQRLNMCRSLARQQVPEMIAT